MRELKPRKESEKSPLVVGQNLANARRPFALLASEGLVKFTGAQA